MKKLFSLAIVLCLTLAMTVPAFAASNPYSALNPNSADNQNQPNQAVDAPYSGPYDGVGNSQNADQSYGFMYAETDGSGTIAYYHDDDAVDEDTEGNIFVWAKVTDQGAKKYKIDIAWGSMMFEFSNDGKEWDPESHTYVSSGGSGNPEWLTSYLDGDNNKITIYNHSNSGITVGFAYAMDDHGSGKTAFNASGTSDDAVIGNFFAEIAQAEAAATVLQGTYSGQSPDPSAVSDTLKHFVYDNGNAGSVNRTEKENTIVLATADNYNDGGAEINAANDSGADYNSDSNNENSGYREKSVYFAFSGTPEEESARGLVLGDFQKVGVITVTIEENLDPALNSPAVAIP